MTSIKHALDLHKEKLERVTNGIAYCDDALSSGLLEQWERKEYKEVRNGHLVEKEVLMQHIERLKEMLAEEVSNNAMLIDRDSKSVRLSMN
jgi:hypothetical protein